MRYYLSGAITKQPHYKEYFKSYEHRLRVLGCNDIYNPASCVSSWDEALSWELCMRLDIEQLMSCDLLVLLPNWRKSKGAKIEKDLCRKIGIPVLSFAELEERLLKYE
jgi:hypothetical protein